MSDSLDQLVRLANEGDFGDEFLALLKQARALIVWLDANQMEGWLDQESRYFISRCELDYLKANRSSKE